MSPANAAARRATVAILVLDSVVPFDLGVPLAVFGTAPFEGATAPYTVRVCATRRGPVSMAGAPPLLVSLGLGALASADTIIVPGIDDLDRPIPPRVCAALRAAYDRGARIASICTGAFVLAAAGLLDGRVATTHWRNAAALAERHPAVRVDPRVLYVDDGRLLTSAGVAAGIDLCLHLVRRDHGAAVANGVARRLVVAPQRAGGQAQFVEAPVPTDGGGLEPTRSWALQRLGAPLTLDALAAHARLSRRTFTRRFRAETGVSPLRWLVHQRVLVARHLLETTDEPVERIAARTGFGSALSLRLHFRGAMKTTPTAYRAAFRSRSAPGAGTLSRRRAARSSSPESSA